jgi:hypothetical protein
MDAYLPKLLAQGFVSLEFLRNLQIDSHDSCDLDNRLRCRAHILAFLPRRWQLPQEALYMAYRLCFAFI